MSAIDAMKCAIAAHMIEDVLRNCGLFLICVLLVEAIYFVWRELRAGKGE